MTWQKSRHILAALIVACTIYASAQVPARPAHETNPRQFDAWYLGAGIALGPNWLFSAGDNPAYASPGYDDSGWKIVSMDEPVESYAPANTRIAWYRIHILGQPALARQQSMNALAVSTQFIAGGYELYFNGVRIGEAGMKIRGFKSQDYAEILNVPDSAAAPRGDVVIAIRVAFNRTGPNGIGAVSPFKPYSVILGTRDAAKREASGLAAHVTVIPFLLAGLALVVGLVALALYLAMRNRPEYLAIAISLLAVSAQGAVVAVHHLQLLTFRGYLLETLFSASTLLPAWSLSGCFFTSGAPDGSWPSR
jgi:hypothetical protein